MKKVSGIIIGMIVLSVVLAGFTATSIFAAKRRLHQRETEIKESPVLSAVQRELGRDILFAWSSKSEDGTITYKYFLKTYEKEVLARLESALNHLDEVPENKINVDIWDNMPFSGGQTCVFCLANYTESNALTEDGKFSRLTLYDADLAVNDDFFMDPSIYTALTDIRYLSIEDDVQRLADNAGIDWFKVWPGLESWDVFTHGGTPAPVQMIKKKPDEIPDVVFAHILTHAEAGEDPPSKRITYISKNGNCYVAGDLGDFGLPVEQMLALTSLDQLLGDSGFLDSCDDDAFAENCRKLRELAGDGCISRPDGLPQDRADVGEWYGFYYDEDWNIQALLLHETNRSCELYADDARANEIYEWLEETLRHALDQQPEFPQWSSFN